MHTRNLLKVVIQLNVTGKTNSAGLPNLQTLQARDLVFRICHRAECGRLVPCVTAILQGESLIGGKGGLLQRYRKREAARFSVPGSPLAPARRLLLMQTMP